MQKIFGFYDRKMNSYFGVSVGVNRMTFLRNVSDISSETALARHADDYHIYELGTFDPATGVIDSKLEFICCLSEVLSNG